MIYEICFGKVSGAMTILHLSTKLGDAAFPYEGRYSSDLTLSQFKKKLEMVVGIASANMKLTLHDNADKFVSELISADDATLAQLNVLDKSIIHVEDVTGGAQQFDNKSTDDVSSRYRINDTSYEARGDSARKWMRELGVDKMEMKVPNFVQPGNRCVVRVADQPDKPATVAFVGQTHFKPGTWVGVIYDDAVGKNDGSIDEHRYFTCEPKHGGFVSPRCIFPPPVENNEKQAEPMEEL